MSEPPRKIARCLADTVQLSGSIVTPCPEDCSSVFFPFSGGLKSTLKLFEVPKNFSCADDEHLNIIGDDSNDAVLCTSNKTYAIKKVETSNSVFLVAPSHDKRFIIESLHQDYYELTSVSPNVEAVQKMLSASLYVSASNDAKNAYLQKNLYTLKDLQNSVRASPVELSMLLNSLGAVEISGFMRMICREALRDVTKMLLDSILEHDWNMLEISTEMCCKELIDSDGGETCDRLMLQFALQNLESSDCSREIVIDNNFKSIWRLDTVKVAREAARIVFRKNVIETGGNIRIPVNEFLCQWTMIVPGAVTNPPIEYLKGIAVEEAEPDSKILPHPGHKISYPCFVFMCNDDIPISSSEKLFEHLFSVRTRYTNNEIEPYVTNFLKKKGESQDYTSLVIEHCTLVDGFYYRKQ